MRVLVVTPWFPSERLPGAGIFNLKDVELLAQTHQVEVLHLVSPQDVDEHEPMSITLPSGVPVTRIPFSSGRVDLIRNASQAVRSASASTDLVHSMAFPALRPVASSRAKLPWVHTEHWSGLVSRPTTLRARVGKAVLSRWLRAPDVVVAVGGPLAREVQKFRKVPPTVIGNQVELTDGTVLPEPPEERGDGPLRLIGVGNLIDWKGPLETVEAVAALNADGVPATLEWAGQGVLSDSVMERARELGIENRVTLLGHMGAAELSAALLRSHIFVLPTAGETFGVAIAEALGHGLPVVTSGEGGHQDFLPENASRLVPSRSGSDIAMAVADLATDSVRWSPQRIFEYARETFSDDVRRQQYGEVYEEALKLNSVRHR